MPTVGREEGNDGDGAPLGGNTAAGAALKKDALL